MKTLQESIMDDDRELEDKLGFMQDYNKFRKYVIAHANSLRDDSNSISSKRAPLIGYLIVDPIVLKFFKDNKMYDPRTMDIYMYLNRSDWKVAFFTNYKQGSKEIKQLDDEDVRFSNPWSLFISILYDNKLADEFAYTPRIFGNHLISDNQLKAISDKLKMAGFVEMPRHHINSSYAFIKIYE